MKTATRPQYHRLQRILEMIREGTRAGSLPNCRQFTRELEVSRRTLMRDLDFLRDDHHAPIAYHGNWYLLALNTAAGRTETFALSRCRSLAGTGQHFSRAVAFDAKAFFKDAFGISQADQPWNVRLLFAREVATYIRERMWHPNQRMRQRRDGTLELGLQTSSRKELTRWILSWMPHVKVLAPRQLQDRVRERMRQGLAHCR
jgi:predicted DNA-binding transcriptional regulator YafY